MFGKQSVEGKDLFKPPNERRKLDNLLIQKESWKHKKNGEVK